MEIENIINSINEWENVKLFFGFQNKSKEYITLSPNIENNLKNDIHDIVINAISKYKNLEKREYNPVGALDGTIEYISRTQFGSVNKLMRSLDNPDSGELNPENFAFTIYQIDINQDRYFFFRRFNKLKSFRKGLFGFFQDSQFKSIKDKSVLGLDDKIDLIIHNEEVLILYHTAFERIFNLDNEFLKNAEKVLANEVFKENIENYESLKEDILNNMNYVKRVSKLLDSESKFLFLHDIKRTEKIIKNLDLDIKIKKGKLIYNNKTQITNFINLMKDAFYRTLIGETIGLDERG